MIIIRKKTPLFSRHLKGAEIFLWEAKTAERAENRTAYESYVIATVISAFSFLDGEINDFFNMASNLEGVDYGEKGSDFGLSFETKARFHYWMENEEKRNELRKKNPLETAQLALKIAGRYQFDKSQGIYQETNIVRRLRNEFVHHTPELRPAGGASVDYDLNDALERRGIQESPLASEGDTDFPDKKLSYHCALWSLQNCIKFSNQFRDKLGWDVTNQELRENILNL